MIRASIIRLDDTKWTEIRFDFLMWLWNWAHDCTEAKFIRRGKTGLMKGSSLLSLMHALKFNVSLMRFCIKNTASWRRDVVSCSLCIKPKSCRLFFSPVCDAAIRHSFRLPAPLVACREKMALITGCNTGKTSRSSPSWHEASSEMQARLQLLHTCTGLYTFCITVNAVQTQTASFLLRWPRCVMCKWDHEQESPRGVKWTDSEGTDRLQPSTQSVVLTGGKK